MTNPALDRDDIIELLTDICATDPRLRLGKMMGHTGIYVGRKMAAFAFDDGLCVKIPRDNQEQILRETPHSRPFMPMGQLMRGWVLLSFDESAAYRRHPLVNQAIHLAELAAQNTRK